VIVRLESPRGRRAFWIAVGLTFVGLGVNTVWRAEFPRRLHVPVLRYDSPMRMGTKEDAQADYRSSEFFGFRRVAWGAVMEGLDPYTDLGHVRAYPPFFAIAFFPFAVVWKLRGVGSAIFFVLGFAFALLSAWYCSRWLRRQGEAGSFGLFALIFILIAPLALSVIVRCESDMFILMPIAVAFLWLVQGRNEFRAGALLGFAASFKVLPGLFGVYLLCRGRWRALAGMVVSGIALTVLLPVLVWGPGRAWALHVSWYRHVVAPYYSAGPGAFIGRPYRPSNQSLAAAAHRTLRPIDVKHKGVIRRVNLAEFSAETVDTVVSTMHALIAIGLIALWTLGARKEECPATRAAMLATVAPGILLLSRVSLTTHHVLLLLPIAALLVRLLERHDLRVRKWSWVLVLYVPAVAGLAIGATKALTPLLPATVCLLTACAVLGLRGRLRHSSLGYDG